MFYHFCCATVYFFLFTVSAIVPVIKIVLYFFFGGGRGFEFYYKSKVAQLMSLVALKKTVRNLMLKICYKFSFLSNLQKTRKVSKYSKEILVPPHLTRTKHFYFKMLLKFPSLIITEHSTVF